MLVLSSPPRPIVTVKVVLGDVFHHQSLFVFASFFVPPLASLSIVAIILPFTSSFPNLFTFEFRDLVLSVQHP